MQTSLMMRLILKDIYMNRVLIIGSMVAVLMSLYVATLGTTGFNIGSVLFITTIIVMGIFVAMFGVVRERENRSWMFVLSLPVSNWLRHWSRSCWCGGCLCSQPCWSFFWPTVYPMACCPFLS